MTVGNIAQNTKDITVNWNMPFDTEKGGWKTNKIKSSLGVFKGHLNESKHAVSSNQNIHTRQFLK